MTSTKLLPMRMADGRLRYASYADEEERQKIIAWAKENGAKVGEDAKPTDSPLQRIA